MNYEVFRKSSALSVGFIAPTKDEKGYMTKSGAVLIKLAMSTGPRKYDFRNALTLALSANELGQLIFGFRAGEETKLVHDPNMGDTSKGKVIKTFIVTPDEDNPTRASVTLSVKDGGNNPYVKLWLEPSDITVLTSLFTTAIPKVLGW